MPRHRIGRPLLTAQHASGSGVEMTGEMSPRPRATQKRRSSKMSRTSIGRPAVDRLASADARRIAHDLQNVFAQVPAAVCTMRGPDHVIESANSLYQQLVGERELIGKMIREAFPEHSQGFFDVLDQVYRSGEPYVGTEVRAVWDRGRGTPEEGFTNFVYQPLRDTDGVVYGIMAHVVDVTELVRSRRLVEEHADELNRLTESLSRMNRELDQFAYVASHDLKAPLRGIASLATWIEDDLGPQLGVESQHHLALLRSRVHRMDALIDGLLEYSRAGRVRNRVDQIRVDDLLQEVIEMLNLPAEASVDIGEGMPTLDTERVPLQQVFLNLLSNAIKHSGRLDTRIRIGAREDGEFFEFAVEDNGPGIPRQFHGKIWDIFQTLHPRDKVEGAGIGLALVKKNVESRGGRAWLESDEGHGAKFFFLWPKHVGQEG